MNQTLRRIQREGDRRKLLDELIGEAQQARDAAKDRYDDSVDEYVTGVREQLSDDDRAKWFGWSATVEWLESKR